MPRYIDADALTKRLAYLWNVNDDSDFANKEVWHAVEEAPTVDIPEVVRCKECFYAIPYNEKWTLPKKNNCMWCKRYEDIRTPDWFCADGERRCDGD